ncbi:MAG: hypothetical protein GTN84_03670 [Hydrogenophaga sp.]|uniref:hypothetical protein n=1 Tax=Hydrogenophaga sp. TaxID=1904254 RepID=UPI0016A758B0|nr:hypothetical protein [Hydrogenophaga sp.]NIM40312.1 hypothetical protein [Hydrogenophaga sp.]NIN25543.1 hypothetical protein [Hydrogenophaga sp.]NIN30195.1 hypothetical protein [Hydrogenophaga sp.]NIN54496.1 hypothetical protein [Hydrogenophaga sp.]NIO50369.1 hypothetical protein [Hydrogenophaga sp.]
MERKQIQDKKPFHYIGKRFSELHNAVRDRVQSPREDGASDQQVLKAAMKAAQRQYKKQPERLVQLSEFLAALKLPDEQMKAFLKTGFIDHFMACVERAAFDNAEVSGDAAFWRGVLISLQQTCGPDAARQLFVVCRPSLQDQLSLPHSAYAHIHMEPPAPLKRSPLMSLMDDALAAADQACMQAVGASESMDKRERNLRLNDPSEKQKARVLNDPSLHGHVDRLVNAMGDDPDALSETVLALRPQFGTWVGTSVVGVLMTSLMRRACERQQAFDLPAFVAALARAGFPSAAMRSLGVSFALAAHWSDGFLDQVVDSVRQRICGSDTPLDPNEKPLWDRWVKELMFQGSKRAIDWSRTQWIALHEVEDRLQLTTPTARSLNGPGVPPPESIGHLSAGAPDAGSEPMEDLLRAGQQALTQALSGAVFSTTGDMTARICLTTVSDPEVSRCFGAIWARRGEGPLPPQELVAWLQRLPARDKALVLQALMHAALQSDPPALDLKAFMALALKDVGLRSEHMIGFVAVLLAAHAGRAALSPLLQALGEMASLPGLELQHLIVLLDLLKQFEPQLAKAHRRNELDPQALDKALNEVDKAIQRKDAERLKRAQAEAALGASPRPVASSVQPVSPSLNDSLSGLLKAARQALGPFANDRNAVIFPKSCLKMVSDPAVEEACGAIWEASGEGRFSLDGVMQAMKGFDAHDKTLVLLGMLFPRLASRGLDNGLESFLITLLRDVPMPGNYAPALAAILLNAYPRDKRLTQLIDCLLSLLPLSELRGPASDRLKLLCKEVQFQASKARTLSAADANRLIQRLDQ